MGKELLNSCKELLLKDLCSRLPYGVKAQVYNHWIDDIQDETITIENLYKLIETFSIGDIKPYLFPLSSMTEEQYNEFFSYYHNIEMAEIKASGDYLKAAYIGDDAKYHWLNKNHFDYRNLIPRGLAIDCTNLNIY